MSKTLDERAQWATVGVKPDTRAQETKDNERGDKAMMSMEEAMSRLFRLAAHANKLAKGEHSHWVETRADCAKDEDALGIAIGLMNKDFDKAQHAHWEAKYCGPKTQHYGHWLPYDKNDMDTLGRALGLLYGMIENTTKTHGTPKGLEWIVKDWKDEPIVPKTIDGIDLPEGYTCTIGWKAYFDGVKL